MLAKFQKLAIKKMSADEKFAAIVSRISSKRNIVVLAGAGISVSCGIPDFRSHGTGLYNTLNYRVRSPFLHVVSISS
jgi:NAD-dependent SIR2 family protein deacetylase